MKLLVGAYIDCCHSHTGISITDAGLKDFSAALGSSSTITAVKLSCKSEWLVTLLWVDPCVVVYAGMFGRRMGFGVVRVLGVFV